jgi:hypothetical protein
LKIIKLNIYLTYNLDFYQRRYTIQSPLFKGHFWTKEVQMLPQITTVVAEMNEEGCLTGAAFVVTPAEVDWYVEHGYATFGTWKAFQDDFHAQLGEP